MWLFPLDPGNNHRAVHGGSSRGKQPRAKTRPAGEGGKEMSDGEDGHLGALAPEHLP